jgi:hypothetical protein
MPRERTARPSPNTRRRRQNGGVASITVAPYSRDPRWATPVARRRTQVFVVDIADRYTAASSVADEDPLLLTA